MPRVRRNKMLNSVYHIIIRGNNREAIFKDYEDRVAYLKRLKRYKEKFKIEVYAYCLMTNHVHLLIYDNGQDISKVMQGLNLSYAIYFNEKYDRVGHVFQGRFTSVMVRKDEHFLYVSKYIHLNPVKANIVHEASQYEWSSYNIYMNNYDKMQIVSTKRMMDYFSKNYMEAIKMYQHYIRENNEGEREVATSLEKKVIDKKQDYFESKVVTVTQVFEVVEQILEVHRLQLIHKNNKADGIKRDICIYLMALTTRKSYKSLGEIFCVKAPAIGASIKRIIHLMINDVKVLNKVDSIAVRINL